MRLARTLSSAVLVAALAVSSTACYGKYALTRSVYKWNGSVGNKFARSALTWALFIIPVYPLAGLADFIIFNPIEFYSGSNPVSLEDHLRKLEQDGHWQLDQQPDGSVIAVRDGVPAFSVRVDDTGAHVHRL